MAKHNEFGKKGEQMAVAFLKKSGYIILKKNYRFQKAEVDIIARKKTVLAIVEVKSRNSTIITDPKDAITPKKIKLLTLATNEYVIKNELDVEVRFDIISIVKEKGHYAIEHIKNAFYHF